MKREDINTLIRDMVKEANVYQQVPTLTCARTAQLLSCAAMLLAEMQRQLATTEESSAVSTGGTGMSKKDHGMTPEELWAWYEAGLSSHGTELGDWEKEAIIRYGRLLTQKQNERVRSTAP